MNKILSTIKILNLERRIYKNIKMAEHEMKHSNPDEMIRIAEKYGIGTDFSKCSDIIVNRAYNIQNKIFELIETYQSSGKISKEDTVKYLEYFLMPKK